ncbi:MAG: serine/threonine-protein kinase, partial [Caldilinea sp.]
MDALEEIRRRGPDPSGIAHFTGRQIGRYLVGQQLGSGGVAAVYRAYDQVEGQTVALKLLLPGADEKSYIRLRNEAMTAGSLRHPHLVRILQIGTAAQGEVAYIAMELVEGASLAELLHQRGRLRPAESANLLEPIARALAAAHAQGIVHRDVKPSNLLLRTVSPGAAHSVQIETLDHPVVPLLTDFGIARALDAPELTSVGRTVGTPAYMAPEQCTRSREIDGRADLYALGAVLYRCLAGRPPFVGATPQVLHAHVYEPVTIEEEVYRQLSPLLVEVLQRSLAKLP